MQPDPLPPHSNRFEPWPMLLVGVWALLGVPIVWAAPSTSCTANDPQGWGNGIFELLCSPQLLSMGAMGVAKFIWLWGLIIGFIWLAFRQVRRRRRRP